MWFFKGGQPLKKKDLQVIFIFSGPLSFIFPGNLTTNFNHTLNTIYALIIHEHPHWKIENDWNC